MHLEWLGCLVLAIMRYADDVVRICEGLPWRVAWSQYRPGGGDDELAFLNLVNGHRKTTSNSSHCNSRSDRATMPTFSIPGNLSIAQRTDSKSLGMALVADGDVPTLLSRFREAVFATLPYLESNFVSTIDKVLFVSSVLYPRHAYRFYTSSHAMTIKTLGEAYDMALRRIVHCPRWVNPEDISNLLGTYRFSYLFDKMRALHTLYTVRAPYVHTDKIAMRCLYSYWLLGDMTEDSFTGLFFAFS